MWEQLSYDNPELSDVFSLENKVKEIIPLLTHTVFKIEAEKLFLSASSQFGSLAGWYNGGSDLFINELVTKIRKKKIKMYIRIIGKLVLSWRRAMERLYKPGGKHDMACRFKYQHFFKKEKKKISPKIYQIKNII